MRAFVIARDRVTYARRCVEALRAAGLEVVIVDHDSSYPPMVDWLYEIDTRYTGPHSVDVAWCVNRHPRDLWKPDNTIALRVGPGERYIVTDCDVVPADDCPADWVGMLGALLDDHPWAIKAGLGLRTFDLPEHFADRSRVQQWESAYQPPIAHPVAGAPAVWADIDTTLAMYRGPRFALGPAIRTTAPYEALHLPWYEDTANPTPEARFYAQRATYGHWRAPEGFEDTHGLEAG